MPATDAIRQTQHPRLGLLLVGSYGSCWPMYRFASAVTCALRRLASRKGETAPNGMLRDQTMLYPLCAAHLYATRPLSARAKGKTFGSILAILIILGTTIARSAEPPGEYQGVLDGAEYVIVVPPKWNVPARPAGAARAVHWEVRPASMDDHSWAVDGRPCRHRLA